MHGSNEVFVVHVYNGCGQVTHAPNNKRFNVELIFLVTLLLWRWVSQAQWLHVDYVELRLM